MKDIVKRAVARPEALIMGPVIAPSTGQKLPIHFVNKRMFSYPESLHIFGQEMGAIVKSIGGAKVVGGETAGIVLAAAISMEAGIPMCYARKEKREPPRYGVEGILRPGESVVLVDDSYVMGGGKMKFIANIEAMGARVTDIVVILDAYQPSYEEGRSLVGNKGIKIHSLCTWANAYEALHEYGYLSDEMAKVALDAVADLASWQGDGEAAKKKWAWFERVRDAQGGRFV